MSAYRVRITPHARARLKNEMDWSRRRWGKGHHQRFRGELLAKVGQLAATRRAWQERPELGPGVRVARHGGLLILFLVNDTAREIEIIGFPNVHRELGSTVADSLAAWMADGDG